ncbi:MAG: hypothetical protein JNK52_11430 [Zoogloeaceae bacterium]|nr:hypothetical protein [Zoogloeaceae bacterium]
MKSHRFENVHPANPRFHVSQADGMYQAIPFVFVTETMYRDIVSEREALLSALPAEDRARQQQVFDRYDPAQSLRGYKEILSLYGI